VTYGAAIIIEECKKGLVSAEELEYLQISIGINHSMIEQIAIYGALGLNVVFIVLPRLFTAIIAVWLIRGWRKLKSTLGFHDKGNL
ncbi:MAG: iron transporter, partial [Chloroflexota bacterium]